MSTADCCPNCGEKIMEHRIVEGTREGSTLYICKTVPRVAESADDLQVGQAVAVGLSGRWRVGTVRREADGRFICDRGNDNGLVLFGWARHQQTVIILAEPELPEPTAQDTEAERDALRRWKSEAMEVMNGLQELGTELHLPLGERITGLKAVEAVRALRVERDELRGRLQVAEAREAIRHKIGGLDELLRERDNLLEQLIHYEESNPEDHCVYIEKLQGLRERIRALADEWDKPHGEFMGHPDDVARLRELLGDA